ncbi:glycoside hydrolase family 10 [Spirosoma aureum]|uniref:Beta-xylanase n=1 Tax=Spirosoma aureum TaxID=2692134 RepID=A0A6G9AJR9_9BACT|nr:endo-1,4-beta-xylanase [Spirosoma aureum]QIP12711.1 glycoside hydrolase family 10 [Spirosoma aureum]
MRCLSLLFVLVTLQTFGQSARYDSLWNDPAVEALIREGIETNRKGDFTLVVTDRQGKPIRNASIEIRQIKHTFLFGANIFMLNGFKTAEQNRQYEAAFTTLFNSAVIPYYWKPLEPQEGKIRFAAGSEEIYRRPPPDVVLDFCQKNGLTPKGHTLVWDNLTWSYPTWFPKDTAKMQPLIDRRIRQIAERYGQSIKIWDVVNETIINSPKAPLPEDYALKAFKTAASVYPKDTRLILNEATHIWENYHREYSPFYMLIENLKAKGADIRGLGLQFHFFSEPLFAKTLAGNAMTPAELFRTLDLYSRFKLPIQISEITIPTLPAGPQGEQIQARLTRNYYRLWFSYPSVEAIYWWNLADGSAAPGEDKWGGGFLKEDLSPKPAYVVLNDLINKEWKTSISTTTKDSNTVAFRGFYGEYVAKITVGKKVIEKNFNLIKGQTNTLKIEL